MKLFRYILFSIIVFVSCSKQLSQTDLLLQGKWKLARDPITGEEFYVYKNITFEQNKFEMNFLYMIDTQYGSGDFIVSGTYYSDSTQFTSRVFI